MLINHKTMMSPMASWPVLPNWLYANAGLTKGASKGVLDSQRMSHDLCQDRFWQTVSISPIGGIIMCLCGLRQ